MGKGIIVFLMLLLAGFAADNQMVQYAHADAGHDKMKSGNDQMEPTDNKMEAGQDKMETGHNKMGSAKHSEDTASEFIRTMTPAGYDAVIGSKNPLEELKYEIVDTADGPVKVFHLTVKDVDFEIFPDKPMQGWGFNGQVPGPIIRAILGERIRIILKNETKDGEHTLHVHGQAKPMSMDGVPYLGQKPLKNGESYTYEFTVTNVGTSWYHCHVDSAHHVDMGMYGAFIVEPKKEKLTYDREYIMLLDEWPTAHVHVHEEAESAEGHDEKGVMTLHGETSPMHDQEAKKGKKRDWYPETFEARQDVYDGFTINGRSFPFTEPVIVKKGDKVRIRFINVGYQQHFMHTHSHRFTVVAGMAAMWMNPSRSIPSVWGLARGLM